MAISVKETTSNKHRRDLAAGAAQYLAMPRGNPDGAPESVPQRPRRGSALTGSGRGCSGSRAARVRVWQIRSEDRKATRAASAGCPCANVDYPLTRTMGLRPETRYAKIVDVHIAYQISGAGPRDLVLASGFVSHLELDWDRPAAAHVFERLGKFARLIRFDKRGTGMSDRVQVATLEERMDDGRAVMDAAQ